MDLPSLQAFVKVVQLGSFTRAAEVLGTQKAHLSRVVSQLERQLGVRLLARSTRALSATEIGRDFYAHAVGILAAVDDARSAVQQAHAQPQGTLRLTCGVEFGYVAVNGWIGRYLLAHPQVQVEAEFTGRVVDIVQEGFDLAVRLGPLPDSRLAARRLGELSYGLYAAPSFLQSTGELADPQALVDVDALIFAGGGDAAGWTLMRGDERRRVQPRARLKANNAFALRDAAVTALGIAQLPAVVAEAEVRAGRLRRVLPDWHPASVPVHAVFAGPRHLTPKVRAFIDTAVEAMQSPVDGAPPAGSQGSAP